MNTNRTRIAALVGLQTVALLLASTGLSASSSDPLKTSSQPLQVEAAVAGQTNFYSRLSLVGTNATGFGNNIKALWWTWTAPANGVVTIDTLGSEAGTVLSVYAGTDLQALLPVQRNDHIPGAHTSKVSFQVSSETTYQILLDRNPPPTQWYGNVFLNLNLIVNIEIGSVVGTDDFNQPHELLGSFARGVANSLGFSQQPGERPLGSGGTTWWTWTAPSDGRVTIDTFGSEDALGREFNTSLFVLSGQTVTSLDDPIVSNDNHAGRLTSLVQFQARARQVYHIAVTGTAPSNPGQGNIVLNLYHEPPPETSGLQIHNSAVEVEFFAKSGQSYQLQSSTDFARWNDEGNPFAGNNATLRWYFSTRFGQKSFYRVKPLLP